MAAATSHPSPSAVTGGAWKRLVTKEDPCHIHKTLGILCLISYAWRMPLAGKDDMGFVKYPQWTLPTLLLHFLLNATSFVFYIPVKRIKSGGYRIWPEYRWHSFIFLCRSLASMALTWYEQEYPSGQQYYWINFAIVMLSIAAADRASHAQGEHQSPTIRGLDIPIGVKYFFSVAQVLATTGVLWGMRRYSTQFVFCWIIQGNAFLMTLRRKNVGSHGFLIFIYGALITIGIGLSNLDFNYAESGPYTLPGMWAVGHTAVLLRLGPRCIPGLSMIQNNKYILWTCMYLLSRQIRTILALLDDLEYEHHDSVYYALFAYGQLSLLAIIGLGVYRQYYQISPTRSGAEELTKSKEA